MMLAPDFYQPSSSRINNETGNTLLYNAVEFGGWVSNDRSINLYFHKAAQHQLSPTNLLTDNLAPFANRQHAPETFHHFQYTLVPRWRSLILYDYFQGLIKNKNKSKCEGKWTECIPSCVDACWFIALT
jgi:hypothetical protein